MSRTFPHFVLALAVVAVCAAGPARVQSASAAPSRIGIAVLVNDVIISNYDLEQRIALFEVTSGVPVTAETLPQIRLDILTSLEDEILELQEAAKRRITVSKAEVDKELQNVAADHRFSVEQMMAAVMGAGVSDYTLRQEIAARLTWRKVVTARYPDVLSADLDEDEATENYLRDLRRDANIVRR